VTGGDHDRGLDTETAEEEVRTVSNIPQETPAKPRRTLRRRIARGLLRCCQFFLLLLLLYFLAALVGLIPVNNDFEPTADGVEIMVTSTAIHGDLVLPIRNETMDRSQHLLPSDFVLPFFAHCNRTIKAPWVTCHLSVTGIQGVFS
jgi:hypothetical protein